MYGQPLVRVEPKEYSAEEDAAIYRSIVEEFVVTSGEDTIPGAVDRVIDYCLMGKEKFSPGSTRVAETCGECYDPIDRNPERSRDNLPAEGEA